MQAMQNKRGDRRVILLIGPPGCGKGTQGAFLARRLQIPVISTGQMLRNEIQAGTPLGRTVQSVLDHGGLVGDELMNRLVTERLRQRDCVSGFALDGYPRTLSQAAFLDDLLDQRGFPRPTVLHLAVSAGTLIERLTARRYCPSCGRIYHLVQQPPRQSGVCDDDGVALATRSDDEESVITERLKAYEKTSAPLLRYYRAGDYHRVAGDRPLETVLADLERILLPVAAVAR